MVETGVAYFSSRTLRHVRADLEDMVGHGCTYVVHCLTETDLLYHRATMAEVVEATHEAGLEAWLDPWAVTAIFSGESVSRFLVDHPEALQVLSDGRRAPAACPNHPATRQFLRDWVQAAADTGGDMAFWDEPHFYAGLWSGDFSGAWGCRCEHCRERFQQGSRRALPETLDEEVRAFRERSLIDLLTELCAESRRLGMRNTLCLIPMDFESVGLAELAERTQRWWEKRAPTPEAARRKPWLEIGVADWEAAAAIPDLDIFGSDPYWYLLQTEPEPLVRAFTQRAVEVSGRHGRDTQIWVQAFLVPEGREDELRLGLRIAAELGATHLAAWSYDGTSSMASVRPDRPDVVWRVLGETFRELRGSP
jgi:hypothetical protein